MNRNRETRPMARTFLMAVALLAAASDTSAHADPMLDTLVAAYPDHLVGYEDGQLIWKDGTRMSISDGRQKNFDQLLDAPDIRDQFAIPYTLGTPNAVPRVNEDPGRFRNQAFFEKMYGNCQKGEV